MTTVQPDSFREYCTETFTTEDPSFLKYQHLFLIPAVRLFYLPHNFKKYFLIKLCSVQKGGFMNPQKIPVYANLRGSQVDIGRNIMPNLKSRGSYSPNILKKAHSLVLKMSMCSSVLSVENVRTEDRRYDHHLGQTSFRESMTVMLQDSSFSHHCPLFRCRVEAALDPLGFPWERVLRLDPSKPQSSTGETQERHE